MNYLAAEEAIIARLQAEVDGLRGVFGAMDQAAILKQSQGGAAVYVVWAGDTIPRDDTDGGQVVRQQWLICVHVHNPRDQVTGGEARKDAGTIITEVLEALTDWSPGDGFSVFHRITAPRPRYAKGGHGYFYLTFETTLVSG
jgi:phage gp37-like protein